MKALLVTSWFNDRFSDGSEDYVRYRPRYPAELGELLAKRARRHETAVDCGCGSGQLTALLAGHFSKVVAIEPSASQLRAAPTIPQVTYKIATAEETGLPDRSADIVVAAQAAHWFDLPRFWQEVARILRPGGVVAVIGYGVPRIESGLDSAIGAFHDVTLKAYWPEERWLVVEGYEHLAFPFTDEPTPILEMKAEWTLPGFINYLSTWSGVKAARAKSGDLLEALRNELAPKWGPRTRTVRWPLWIKLGRAGRRSDVG